MTSTRDPKTSESAPPDDELTALRKEVSDLKIILGRATARIQKLETELETARAQVAWFQTQLFGQKAERTPRDLESAWLSFLKEQEAKARGFPAPPITTELQSAQLLLDFFDPRTPSLPPTQEPAPAPAEQPPAAPPKGNKRGHGRKQITELVQADPIILEPEPGEVPDGARMLSVEVSNRLAVQRARLICIPVVRPKYAVDNHDGTTRVITAPPPHEMIPRGLFAPSGLAHVIASKWDRHVPYHRLASFFAAEDYYLSPSTLSGVVIRAAPLAKTLVEAMELYARSVAPYLAIDATSALLQKKDACLRGHTWVRFIEDVCVLISFTNTHDSVTAGEQLDGWTCPTVGDGTQVYDRKHRETGNARGGCMSHGRRKLIYAAPTDGRALPGIKLANDLFALERKWIDLAPADRLEERRKHSRPVVEQLFAWRDALLQQTSLPPRGLLAKALRYLRNQADRLSYFLQDGAVPIHNNAAELRLRHFAVGRKNWLFYGSEAGADAGSTWLSLVLSARMHGLPVEPYLRDLFRVLPAWPIRRVLELAPHRWRATRDRLDRSELEKELGPITIPPPLES